MSSENFFFILATTKKNNQWRFYKINWMRQRPSNTHKLNSDKHRYTRINSYQNRLMWIFAFNFVRLAFWRCEISIHHALLPTSFDWLTNEINAFLRVRVYFIIYFHFHCDSLIACFRFSYAAFFLLQCHSQSKIKIKIKANGKMCWIIKLHSLYTFVMFHSLLWIWNSCTFIKVVVFNCEIHITVTRKV